jgi:acetyl-CoA carboxylase carboxyl transferase subunit alpha
MGAAEAMKISAEDLKSLAVIDAIVPEPVGGAHRDPAQAVERLGDAIEESLDELASLSPDELRRHRRQKFLAIGRAGLA